MILMHVHVPLRCILGVAVRCVSARGAGGCGASIGITGGTAREVVAGVTAAAVTRGRDLVEYLTLICQILDAEQHGVVVEVAVAIDMRPRTRQLSRINLA